MKIFKIGHVHDMPQLLSLLGKKTSELWSAIYGDLSVESYPLK